MLVEPGTKILISHRRLFETDAVRFFIGQVDGYEAGIARITGYTWLRDGLDGTFHRKSDPRTKILSLSSGSLMIYQLPDTVDIERAQFKHANNHIWIADGESFKMEMSETAYGNLRRTTKG